MEVVITNKAAARDPEGEVIHRDLVKSNFPMAKTVRAGKFLKFEVEAVNSSDARKLVKKMCDDLRIYNPAAHDCRIALGRTS